MFTVTGNITKTWNQLKAFNSFTLLAQIFYLYFWKENRAIESCSLNIIKQCAFHSCGPWEYNHGMLQLVQSQSKFTLVAASCDYIVEAHINGCTMLNKCSESVSTHILSFYRSLILGFYLLLIELSNHLGHQMHSCGLSFACLGVLPILSLFGFKP